MSNFKIALEATTDRFRTLLPKHGFGAQPQKETDAAYRRIWLRAHSWKSDAVEIVYRRGGESSILINFEVRLPVPGNDEHMVFDCRGVLTPRIPSIGWRWIMTRHVNKVATALESQLPWFDAFATPAACLESLARPDRNVPRLGTRVELMCDYLRSLGSSP